MAQLPQHHTSRAGAESRAVYHVPMKGRRSAKASRRAKPGRPRRRRNRESAEDVESAADATSLRSLHVSDAFKTFVLDQLEELDVTPRSMFGGIGLYSHGVFFGIMAGDTLYLKIDESTKPDYVRAGSGPFKPFADRPDSVHYYAVPVDILESRRDLGEWAGKAIAAGHAASGSPVRDRRRR
jgi:DNA transformation protein and related proteins